MTNSNGQGGSALSLDDCKRSARARALAAMACFDPAAGLAVGAHILCHVTLHPPAVIAGFLPIGRELDLTRTLLALRAKGFTLALPRTPARGLPLTFRRWAEGDALMPGTFGTTVSAGPPVDPDLLLVPLLAFDRRGHRLGYGGGYYDRTIASRPGIRTIGCAYAALEMAEVPTGPTDQPLDAIATENGFIVIKG